jgi:hypothetical protein
MSTNTTFTRALTSLKRFLLLRQERHQARGTHHEAGDYQYLVIFTYGRTGSTVLQGALNSIDGICIRGENYGAVNQMEKLHKVVARTHNEQSGGITTDTISPWYGAHMIDVDGTLKSLRQTLVAQILRPPAGTTVVGFKEIRHTPDYFDSLDGLLEYALFLDKLLPGVKFVVNTRNAEDTSKSGWWKDDPNAPKVLETAREWMLALPEHLRARLGKDRVVVMDYETWNKNPEELARMIRELGFEPDMARLEEVSTRRLDHMQQK